MPWNVGVTMVMVTLDNGTCNCDMTSRVRLGHKPLSWRPGSEPRPLQWVGPPPSARPSDEPESAPGNRSHLSGMAYGHVWRSGRDHIHNPIHGSRSKRLHLGMLYWKKDVYNSNQCSLAWSTVCVGIIYRNGQIPGTENFVRQEWNTIFKYCIGLYCFVQVSLAQGYNVTPLCDSNSHLRLGFPSRRSWSWRRAARPW